MGRRSEAVTSFIDAMERGRRSVGPDHAEEIRLMTNCAEAQRAVGRGTEAELLALEAMERFGRVLGAAHPGTIQAMGIYARACGLGARC